MLILTLRTDKPTAEIGLYEYGKCLEIETWEGHRQLSSTIHKKIEKLLKKHGKRLEYVRGIVFFVGPGSFTGLRIGVTVANALAHGLGVPIVGSNGKDWVNKGIEKINNGIGDKLIIPRYGAEPDVTEPGD